MEISQVAGSPPIARLTQIAIVDELSGEVNAEVNVVTRTA